MKYDPTDVPEKLNLIGVAILLGILSIILIAAAALASLFEPLPNPYTWETLSYGKSVALGALYYHALVSFLICIAITSRWIGGKLKSLRKRIVAP